MAEYSTEDMGWGRLAYRKIDPGTGAVPMVLLHGGGADGTTWDAVTPSLAAARPVYLPDMRGTGRSDRAPSYEMEDLRDDVLALLDRWELDRVILVGHSLGAYAGLLAAQAAPERLATLILEECPPPKPLGLTVPPPADESAPFYHRKIRPGILRRLNDPDPAWWRDLERVLVPALVLSGGPESFLPGKLMEEMAARLPAASFAVVPAGHAIHERAPEEFVTAVEGFLAT